MWELSAVEGETFSATVRVTNTGPRAGRHVVQLYGTPTAADFPGRVLLGFAPVSLDAGAAISLVVTGSTRPLQRWTDKGFEPVQAVVPVEAAAWSGVPPRPRERSRCSRPAALAGPPARRAGWPAGAPRRHAAFWAAFAACLRRDGQGIGGPVCLISWRLSKR
ncbi:hypothetical protein ACIA5D_42125 [Actinoplanes sp. NPDC051513]|uniref:hypothetical protein n=1 Tax=Actinoplanes sp. NPDC051513 TaxID=3363908 RepID=UPI00378E4017